MNLHPFNEVIKTAHERMTEGWDVHLQFNCAHCGTKQTFEEENYLSTTGKCEECGKITNLQSDGCNILIHRRAK
jgi:uncharacterized protein (DUF983 family)